MLTTATPHPVLKLGKNEAKQDDRNLRMSTILSSNISFPPTYSITAKYPAVHPRMFLNDTLGDCVMACRANQTLFFEYIEQNHVLNILDSEVQKEYFKETGGPDSGLVILDSLNKWRKTGWRAAGKTYAINLFTEINRNNLNEVKAAIFSDCGAPIGIELPVSAQAELDAGKPWSQTTGRGAAIGSWGGHCVLLSGYDAKYLYCITWGQKQAMTWEWFHKYCSEAYGVIDALNTAKKLKLFNARLIDKFLSTI